MSLLGTSIPFCSAIRTCGAFLTRLLRPASSAASIISSGGSTPNAAPAFLLLAGYGSCSPRSQRLICIAHIPHLLANFCFVRPEPLYKSKSHFAAGFMLLPPAPCKHHNICKMKLTNRYYPDGYTRCKYPCLFSYLLQSNAQASES